METSSSEKLVRAVGLFGLTAIALNGMIGSGIFVLPATVAKILGPASPLAYLVSGMAVVLIVLCFAEVGSMFERAGGPYVYAREAFGSFIGFEVGWMFLLARLTATAAISNAFTAYLGFFWPALAGGAGRIASITVALTALAWVNMRGVRFGAWTVNFLTVGKLVPMLFFIIAGLFLVDLRPQTFPLVINTAALRQAGLVLIFAFGGFEFASVPSEEVINPRRNLPLALMAAIGITVILYLFIQIVAFGALPELASATAPLATAAQRFLGSMGAAVMTLGAILSTTGTNSATLLVGPRVFYVLARDGRLPAVLARVHPRFRTPYVSIALFAVMAWILAVFGSFAQLAAVSAIARLLYYITTCLSVPILRRKMPQAERAFKLLGGPLIPGAAVAISLWLLTGSTAGQVMMGVGALLLGGLIYGLQSRAVRVPLDHVG
ncbi:MAG: amino acid permease [Acidobacteria bacterium]|nr:amino acid permease [Acidobacteriota bacterium]MBI3657885.1 amino acid permease [Acidobacteriota bacterium]